MNFGQFLANFYIQFFDLQSQQAQGIAGIAGIVTMIVAIALVSAAITGIWTKYRQAKRGTVFIR